MSMADGIKMLHVCMCIVQKLISFSNQKILFKQQQQQQQNNNIVPHFWCKIYKGSFATFSQNPRQMLVK